MGILVSAWDCVGVPTARSKTWPSSQNLYTLSFAHHLHCWSIWSYLIKKNWKVLQTIPTCLFDATIKNHLEVLAKLNLRPWSARSARCPSYSLIAYRSLSVWGAAFSKEWLEKKDPLRTQSSWAAHSGPRGCSRALLNGFNPSHSWPIGRCQRIIIAT